MNTEEEFSLVERRLAEDGIICSDPYLLTNDKKILKRAAPVLMELLPKVKSLGVKSALIRVASDGPTPPGNFIAELRMLRAQIERGDRQAAALGWDLGEAIHKRANSSVYSEIEEILRDKGFRKTRQMLTYALAKIKSRRSETIQTLLDAARDEDLAAHALGALAKMKAVEAIPVAREYLDSNNTLFRNSAAKALKKLKKIAKNDDRPTSGTEQNGAISFGAGMAEASVNLNTEQIGPFLRHLCPLLEGFGQAEIELIESRLLDIEVDEQEIFNLQVRYVGQETPMKIVIFMDDIDAPDIAFFTSAELAAAIEKLIEEVLM